jgi:hypothetical protein
MDIIRDVQNSKRWNKFPNKQNIIDSINSIKFYMVDSSIYVDKISKNSVACFIDLHLFKKKSVVTSLLEKPNYVNVIFINKSNFYQDKNISSVLTQ